MTKPFDDYPLETENGDWIIDIYLDTIERAVEDMVNEINSEPSDELKARIRKISARLQTLT